MLYNLNISDKEISPHAFLDLASLQKLEKDLEELLGDYAELDKAA
jgi:hypothetical protein